MRTIFSLLVAALFIGLPGCGAGAAPGPGPAAPLPEQTISDSMSEFEGSMAEDGTTDPDVPLRVGYDHDGHSWRTLLRFGLPVPVWGRWVTSVELVLHQGDLIGSPYKNMGALIVERIDMGSRRDFSAYTSASWPGAVASFDPSAAEIRIDVTDLVSQALHEARRRIDFRLRFEESAPIDGTPAETRFTSSVAAVVPASGPPRLEFVWGPSLF